MTAKTIGTSGLGRCSKGCVAQPRWPCRASAGLRGQEADLDDGDADGNQLLGKGKAVRRKDRRGVLAAVQGFISKWRPKGWDAGDVTSQCSNIREHKHADVPGVGSVACTTYGRARTRVSYYVLHRSENAESVARIERFVMVSKAGLQPLRLAVGLCYAERPPLRDGRVHVVSTTAANNRAAAIAVEDITALLVSAQPSKPAGSAADRKRYHYAAQLGKVFFARHCHMSRMADQQLG